jgi:hypothetical protein
MALAEMCADPARSTVLRVWLTSSLSQTANAFAGDKRERAMLK